MLRASQVLRGGERPGRGDQLAASAHFFSRSRVARIWAAFTSVRFMTPVSRQAGVLYQPGTAVAGAFGDGAPAAGGGDLVLPPRDRDAGVRDVQGDHSPGAAAIPTVPGALGCRVVVTPPAGVRSCVD